MGCRPTKVQDGISHMSIKIRRKSSKIDEELKKSHELKKKKIKLLVLGNRIIE